MYRQGEKKRKRREVPTSPIGIASGGEQHIGKRKRGSGLGALVEVRKGEGKNVGEKRSTGTSYGDKPQTGRRGLYTDPSSAWENTTSAKTQPERSRIS